MKYNTYIVQLKHRDNSLAVSVVLADGPISAKFRKIGNDLFEVIFKDELELRFLQVIPLKNMNKSMIVLQPVTSEYNKKKYTKLSKFLEVDDPSILETKNFLVQILEVEEFLRVEDLLYFFTMTREEVIPMLLEMEIRRELKIIDFTYLTVTAYSTIIDYQKEMQALLTDCYTSRTKSVKLQVFEDRIQLPQSSILFRYLLHTLKTNYAYTISKDKIVFKKLSMSDDEKDSIEDIEHAIQDTKLMIFSIDNVLADSTDLVYKDVNTSFGFMVEHGQLIRLNEKYFMFTEELNKMVNRLKTYKRNQGEWIDIQAFREFSGLSRKYIIILFEYLDTQQITERVENKRRILLTI